MTHKIQWFQERIGKTIYRDEVDCRCPMCRKGTMDGIIVVDQQTAEYLFMVQNEIGVDYRDVK